ncbi:MAG TPA: ABC transporter substrate-binding protein [Chthoniobacterales bacterium]|nr:ABC transporter substrate-binding protein [Chthoniobacterales bacterium]
MKRPLTQRADLASANRAAKILARSFLVVLVLLCSFLAANCQRKPADGTTPVSIRLKWLHQAQFAGFYYAKEAGLYSQEGLEVTLLPGGVDYPAIQMVASRSDLFGVTGADQILIAREKGIPVVAVACIFRKSPFVLFSLKDSGIGKVEDFLGRKIGVKLGGNEELTYRAMLRKTGISPSLLTEVPVKFDISLLLTKQVDVWPGYSINEPITAEEKGFPVNLIWPETYGVQLYADVLFTTEEVLRTRPDLVAGVVQATVEGWNKSFADRDTAITYTLKYGEQLTREHERRMLDASYPLVVTGDQPIGSMELSVWKGMHALLRDGGFLKGDVDLSVAFRVDFLPVSKK